MQPKKTLLATALILLLLIFGVSACAVPTPQATTSPLSTSISPFPTMMPVQTSLPGLGTVVGRLVGQSDKAPLADRDVHLALITPSSDGKYSMAALQQGSPAAMTDNDGRFSFSDVQPGTYGLVMDSALNTLLLKDLSTDKEIVVTVGADNKVDLGSIEILPGY